MNFSVMRWEIAVTVLMLVLFFADLFFPRISKRILGLGAAYSLGLFLFGSLFLGNGLPPDVPRLETAHGLYVLDTLAIWAKQFSMLTTLLTILISIRFFGESDDHLSEYFILQLLVCLGMMLVSSTADFFSSFVALELMTVSFYVLVSFQRKNILCLEAALKYLIYGGVSSGILLYGIALIYGSSGEIHFAKVAEYALFHIKSNLLLMGLLLVLVGLAFKISAVPFHWWTADVYEGAPTPTVALLSIGSKGAGFVLLIRVLFEVFPSYQAKWLPLLIFASGGSILYGNLAALSQSNLKRLMGYSSISHSGYMLLGVAASSVMGLSAVLYYLLGYLLANALIFGVMCETAAENPRQDIRSYAGLSDRSGWAATALVFGLLSLAGIPPLAGFFGKLLLFQVTFEQSFFILLGLAVLGVVCSLYYYLGVIRTMYFSNTNTPSTNHTPLKIPGPWRWFFGLLIGFVIMVGFYQLPWWQASETAVRSVYP